MTEHNGADGDVVSTLLNFAFELLNDCWLTKVVEDFSKLRAHTESF